MAETHNKRTETNACDCIIRQAAISEIGRWKGYLDDDMVLRMQTGLKRLPSVDAVPVKHGRWIKKRYWIDGAGMGERYGYYYSCSKCGNLVCGGYDECGKKYCDECGARMDGKEGDKNG